VDYATLKRTPKASAQFIAKLAKANSFEIDDADLVASNFVMIEAAAASGHAERSGVPLIDRKQGSNWVVVGGGSAGGIVVRKGDDLKSPELPRLSTGSRIELVEWKGDRMKYKKLSGDGPDNGWISFSVKGTKLVNPAD